MAYSSFALLVINMQKAYFKEEALAVKRGTLVRRCNELIKIFKGKPIYNIRTEHKPDRSSWTLNMLEDGGGTMFEGSGEVGNLRGIDTLAVSDIVKTRDSAFSGTDLKDVLVAGGVEALVLCGVSTHSSILQTAAEAYAADFNVVLAQDAIASYKPLLHEPALAILHQEYRLHLMTNKQVLSLVT